MAAHIRELVIESGCSRQTHTAHIFVARRSASRLSVCLAENSMQVLFPRTVHDFILYIYFLVQLSAVTAVSRSALRSLTALLYSGDHLFGTVGILTAVLVTIILTGRLAGREVSRVTPRRRD